MVAVGPGAKGARVVVVAVTRGGGWGGGYGVGAYGVQGGGPWMCGSGCSLHSLLRRWVVVVVDAGLFPA
jgi:hypothetical protein